jgi:hypothetical protein
MSAYIQSVGGDADQVFERTYFTNYSVAWDSVLDALKYSRLDVSNKESGFIQTKWTDNTVEKNLADSFGGTDAYLKAQYRFRISISKGFNKGTPTVKAEVQKEQVVQRDVLEGWRPVRTDSIDEKTLLYRIARVIFIKSKIAQLEEQKVKKLLEKEAPSSSE